MLYVKYISIKLGKKVGEKESICCHCLDQGPVLFCRNVLCDTWLHPLGPGNSPLSHLLFSIINNPFCFLTFSSFFLLLVEDSQFLFCLKYFCPFYSKLMVLIQLSYKLCGIPMNLSKFLYIRLKPYHKFFKIGSLGLGIRVRMLWENGFKFPRRCFVQLKASMRHALKYLQHLNKESYMHILEMIFTLQ